MATPSQTPPAAAPASQEGMFSAVDRVPEMLRGVISPGAAVPNPANISLHRLSLSFWEKETRCSPLEVTFQRRQGASIREVGGASSALIDTVSGPPRL